MHTKAPLRGMHDGFTTTRTDTYQSTTKNVNEKNNTSKKPTVLNEYEEYIVKLLFGISPDNFKGKA